MSPKKGEHNSSDIFDKVFESDDQDDFTETEEYQHQDSEAQARELLGLDKKWELFDTVEKKNEYLKSEMRKRAYNNISTSTNPRGDKIREKQGIVCELLRENLIDEKVLKEKKVIYLGSGDSVEYPLTFGARNIVLVDGVFEISAVVHSLKSRIQSLIGDGKIVQGDGLFEFEFDFGDGLEKTRVEYEAKIFKPSEHDTHLEEYELPADCGLVIAFAPNRPMGTISLNDITEEQEKTKDDFSILYSHLLVDKDGQMTDLSPKKE